MLVGYLGFVELTNKLDLTNVLNLRLPAYVLLGDPSPPCAVPGGVLSLAPEDGFHLFISGEAVLVSVPGALLIGPCVSKAHHSRPLFH